MFATLTTLIDRLETKAAKNTNVIFWGSPVPAFGDLENSKVATLGLNPSNREFVDEAGKELTGISRRFHTLSSLRLKSWSAVEARHLQFIIESCQYYFQGNPYDRWFRVLDYVIKGTKTSFYSEHSKACHLDLIPYATTKKWTELSSIEKKALASFAGDTLGMLVRDSPIELIILNGRTVAETFQSLSKIMLVKKDMKEWSLPRKDAKDVIGVSYYGITNSISNVPLGREVLILGYNHNLQSSFGVTKQVVQSIQKWISIASLEFN